jgi:hypothetical protein
MATVETLVPREEWERVVEGTFVLSLTMGNIRTRAPVKREKVRKMADALRGTDAELDAGEGADELHVSKELLKVDEIKAIVGTIAGTRSLIRSNAAPCRFLKGGLYLYPVTRVEWVDEQIARATERIDALLDALEPRWAEIIEEEAKRLAPLGLFDPRDYPTLTSIREVTRIRHTWLRFEVPTALKGISQKLFDAEREKAKSMWQDAFDDIRLAYRETLADFVTKLRGALTPGEDGKTKVVRQASVDKMIEFLSTFRVQDVTGDRELAALVDKTKALMRGVDAEVLRSEDAAAARIAKGMSEINDALAPLVIEQTRKVRLRNRP